MRKILLVEDDETIALGIKVYLEKNDYKVQRVGSIEEAKLMLLNDKSFNAASRIGTVLGEALSETDAPHKEPLLDLALILLDLNLPDGEGYELCQFIRKRSNLPIIFLTVCDEEEQVVKGLDLGADDYVTKPFRLSILLSRIQAVLRRSQYIEKEDKLRGEKVATHNLLSCGNVRIEEAKKYVYLNDEKVELTAGEYKLLLILLTNKNHTLTRQFLLQKLWDEEEQYVNDNTLTVTMKRLREKLGYPSFIKTIRGIGYLVEEDE